MTPQIIMALLLLWEGIAGFYRMERRSPCVSSSLIASFARVATVGLILNWGGFWNA